MRPFARLRSAKGRVYSRAVEFLALIKTNLDHREEQGEERPKRRRGRGERAALDGSKHFMPTRLIAVIFTGPTWRGRNTPQGAV